ncbi:hypothetical protein EU545_02415 [Candidatus Thorarchaeota archaeon]|nr:MAG: hypothetical protein EU545_02415 [Candidatus Thorarchaeota archaeon]
MNEDSGRSDDYWMGVRDALRMVDSFLKWSRKNEDKAKSLEDFVHDGLIAAAKRCESCLSEKLGLKFQDDKEESPEDTPSEDFEITPKSLAESGVETVSDTRPEKAVTEDHEEVLEESKTTSEPVTVDSVERIADESMSEYDVEGPPRDFSSDFELVEPSPLVVEDEPDTSEESAEKEEHVDEEEDESSEPSFTWSEYEKAVTPSEEELPEEEEPYIETSSEEPKEVWSPYDEPSISEEELKKEIKEDSTHKGVEAVSGMDDESEEETEAPVTEPPPPPPPPESDEDEEERKRRARRLFFGA